MIKIDSTSTVITGELTTLLSEMTTILNKFYLEMKNSLGEEQANEYLVEIGRLAVMTDEELQSEASSRNFS